MKILCLHGYRHNVNALKKSMDELIKKLNKKQIEFDFFQSPIKYIPTKEELETKSTKNDYYQWWSATKENIMTNEHYDTIDESLINLTNKWKSDNYDGILGFSQGSVLIQLFIYQIQKKQIETYEPKFIILVSSYPPTDLKFIDYHQTKKHIKTIIISGTNDDLVSIDVSMNLRDHFPNVSMLLHPGGHYVSSSTEIIYPLLKLLQKIEK